MHMTRNQIRVYRRRIPQSLRGLDFKTRAECQDCLDREARREFVEARSQYALDSFVDAFLEIERSFAVDAEARRKLERLLASWGEVRDLGRELATSDLPEMTCSRVLVRIAPVLEACLDSELSRIFQSETSDPDSSSSSEAWRYSPHTWAAVFTYMARKKRPTRRTMVLMALQKCGALGPPRDFRTLAAASFVAGCGTFEFVPGETTLGDAFDDEVRQMRQVAHREAPGWAAAPNGEPETTDSGEDDAQGEDNVVFISREPVALYAA